MIRRFRRTRLVPLLSVATLLCVVSLSGSSLFHTDNDDIVCNPALVVHDHAAHRVGPDSQSSPKTPDHCFICHWHSLRTVQTVVHVYAPATAGRTIVGIVSASLAAARLTRQPARAPPLA